MTRNDDDKVRKEADRWFARRLDPAAREGEREAFERWREGNPRRAAAYTGTVRLWDKLTVLKQSERLRQAIQDTARSRGFVARAWSSPAIRYPVFLAVTASLAAVVILSLVHFERESPVQTFATKLGEERTERLADGTTLRLNTSSLVEVTMTHHRRKVTLRKGEAVFDVTRDASRPFVVSAGDGTVTAVGTQFQVRREANTVAVTLIEGRVQVARASRREVESLDPGQQATFLDNTNGIVTRNVDVRLLTRWMSGRLEFRNTPLKDAVVEVNRYSARKIRIGDPAISELAVSGTFRTGDVDGVAAAFEAAFGMQVESSGAEVVLYGR